MLLFAKSFFLSFSTLWRYLLVMPFVAIPGLLVVFAVSALVFGGGVVFLLILSPVLLGGLMSLILIFLFTSLTCFNIMIGCRAAFGAMGRVNDLDFGRLVGKSMTFTLMQMIMNIFLLIVGVGVVAVVFLMSPGSVTSFDGITANPEAFVASIATHPVTIALAIGAAFFSLALSALLAVPMAGSAISATPKMGPIDAFTGLGAAFLPVLAVLIATTVLCTITGAYAISFGFFSVLISNAVLLITSQPAIWPPAAFMLLGFGMTVLVIWASCWFYAAAALGWNRFSDDRDAALAYKADYDRFSPDDLRSLREQRERERSAMAH